MIPSPYLFVIGMEALSCLINRAVEGNYLSGSRIANGRGEDLSISHLLYADDMLLFCEADIDQLKFLSWILTWFKAMSSLKINLSKSEIIPIGPVTNLVELASELGCKIGSFPTSYLGLPLGAKHKALGVLDSIEERYRKRLTAWKTQYISKGDRITLIRSTLSSFQYIIFLFFVCLRKCAPDWKGFKSSSVTP